MHRDRHRTRLVVLTLLVVAAGASAGAAISAPWPQTRAGELGRAWTEAFSSGEAEMRAFFTQSLATSSLAERSMDQRLTSYRELYKRLGKLELKEIVAHPAGELHVVLTNDDDTEIPAVFRVESTGDRKLLNVQLTLNEHRHGGGHGH